MKADIVDYASLAMMAWFGNDQIDGALRASAIGLTGAWDGVGHASPAHLYVGVRTCAWWQLLDAAAASTGYGTEALLSAQSVLPLVVEEKELASIRMQQRAHMPWSPNHRIPKGILQGDVVALSTQLGDETVREVSDFVKMITAAEADGLLRAAAANHCARRMQILTRFVAGDDVSDDAMSHALMVAPLMFPLLRENTEVSANA